jgi:hypothetical protein
MAEGLRQAFAQCKKEGRVRTHHGDDVEELMLTR